MASPEHDAAERNNADQRVRYRPARANLSTAVPFDHLHRAARRAELVEAGLQAAAAVAYEWDFETDRMSWSENWTGFVGGVDCRAPTCAGELFAMIASEDRGARYEAMFGTDRADEGEGVPYRVRYRLAENGEVEEEGRWHIDKFGRPHSARGILRRIAAGSETAARAPASTSALVGDEEPLLSRSGLAAALGREIGQAVRGGGTAGFLLVGIDRLSLLNRAYGFEIADRLIEAVWRRIRQALPGHAQIGRYTGNKLGIVLPRGVTVDLEGAAAAVLEAAGGEPIATEGGLVPVSVSLGGVRLPEHANSAEMALLRAEEALASAREVPKPSFAVFAPSSERELKRASNLKIADRIVAGLNDRRFHLHFQPVVSAENANVTFYECLLRLTEEDGTVTSAGAYMPAAEELGLARLLDHRVLELVLKVLEDRPDVSLSLNVSPLTAVYSDWLECLTTAIRVRPEIASRLIVEITETVAIEDVDSAVRFVETLHGVGCRVAMDDFGAGYTSFRNLKLLNVDIVKIDGGFVHDLSNSPDDQVFVRALIDLARNFGLETVAECVEHQRDADLLASWGVGCLQGYLCGAPIAGLPPAQAVTSAARGG